MRYTFRAYYVKKKEDEKEETHGGGRSVRGGDSHPPSKLYIPFLTGTIVSFVTYDVWWLVRKRTHSTCTTTRDVEETGGTLDVWAFRENGSTSGKN